VDWNAEEDMSTIMIVKKGPKRPAKGQFGSSKWRGTPSKRTGKIMRGRDENDSSIM